MTRVQSWRMLGCLVACAVLVPIVTVAAEGGLLTGIPTPTDSKSLGTGEIGSGGEKAN